MRYQTFGDASANGTFPMVFLAPAIRKDGILDNYVKPYGLDEELVLAIELHYTPGAKKTKAEEMRRWINEELVQVLKDCDTQYVMCADGEYFKMLTGERKVDSKLGYVLDCLPEYGTFKVTYIPSYRMVFHDPVKTIAKIKQAINAVETHASGTYKDPGQGNITTALYPKTHAEIEAALEMLLDMNVPLAIDIEAFSLKHYDAGIGTISFAWNQEEGIAFAVDYQPEEWEDDGVKYHGRQVYNGPIRDLLLKFFNRFAQTAVYHNIAYDVYNLIYQLYMEHICDTGGLLYGIEKMLKNWDDTKLITYLATNSCAGNELGLKDQSQEYSGDYAVEEIKDIRKIPLDTLLEYNLVDSLSTWFTHTKHYGDMVKDQQLDVYTKLFKPATVDIIQMQLTGMPLNMKRVAEVKVLLQKAYDDALHQMQGTQAVQRFTYRMREAIVLKKNAEYKKKRITLADVTEEFNPNSGPQLQDLLFEMLGLPVLSRTKSKQPGTDGDSLKALRNHTKDPDILLFLNGLIDYKAVDKILTSFIPAMEQAQLGPDGWYYLFGNFNLGGTVSGRLSSSKPNMQNLPANSKWAKLIKSCFQAPPGWIFAGLDFASLEDRISALTTKDPNKLKVYTDGYDGHCLRAFSYFGDQMVGINGDSVASINSIEHLYKPLRQDSKAPTFALTYQGTYLTLMKNCGFSMEKAKLVEDRYNQMYKVSVDWVQHKLNQAAKDGYVTVAFGLRVRTPLLAQVIRGTRVTPREAEAEGRTAGNALGQSWCLLNSRAASEFMGGVRKSEFRLDIRPCCHIHDAQYYLIRDDIAPVMYTNKHLVKAVEWQDHPEIAHPDVKLGGELSFFYPSWEKEIGIPNGASEEEIFAVIDKAMA